MNDLSREASPSRGGRQGARFRFALLVNRDAGTVRSLGEGVLSDQLERAIEELGLDCCRMRFIPGRQIDDALGEHAQDADCDLVMIGGGDGTVSSAARLLSAAGKPMGVLPLGTMNLFTRALGLPVNPVDALSIVRHGRIVACDMGEIGDRRFVHHVSLGLHPRLLRLRNRMNYASRLQKILAAARAYFVVVREARLYEVRLTADEAAEDIRASLLIVSNNVLGQGIGHLPHPDVPDGGVLGIYYCTSRQLGDLLTLSAAALAGQWQDNPQIVADTARRLQIDVGKKRVTLSIDGEVVKLKPPFDLRVLPAALQVLRPDDGRQVQEH